MIATVNPRLFTVLGASAYLNLRWYRTIVKGAGGGGDTKNNTTIKWGQWRNVSFLTICFCLVFSALSRCPTAALPMAVEEQTSLHTQCGVEWQWQDLRRRQLTSC